MHGPTPFGRCPLPASATLACQIWHTSACSQEAPIEASGPSRGLWPLGNIHLANFSCPLCGPLSLLEGPCPTKNCFTFDLSGAVPPLPPKLLSKLCLDVSACKACTWLGWRHVLVASTYILFQWGLCPHCLSPSQVYVLHTLGLDSGMCLENEVHA